HPAQRLYRAHPPCPPARGQVSLNLNSQAACIAASFRASAKGIDMIGIVKSSLPQGREMTALQSLEAAAALRLEGVLFNTLFDISPALDSGEMNEVKAEAARLGLRLSAGLGCINPALPFRGAKIVETGDGHIETGVRRLIECAAEIGIFD